MAEDYDYDFGAIVESMIGSDSDDSDSGSDSE